MKKNNTFILYLYKIKLSGVELPIYAPTQFENYLLRNNIKYVRTSLDEIYEIIDNETEFTDYLLIGYDSDGVPHTQMGHIDITKNSTKVKKLTRK